MSSTVLIDYQERVVAQIHEHLPLLKTCTTHPGKMTIEELKGIAIKAPAVHVAMLNIGSRPNADGVKEKAVTMIAYVTTRDTSRLPSEQSAINIVEALGRLIPRRQFHPLAYTADDTAAANLYSKRGGSLGVSLWGVTWKQTIRLDGVPDGPLLKTLYIDDVNDASGTIVVGDE